MTLTNTVCWLKLIRHFGAKKGGTVLTREEIKAEIILCIDTADGDGLVITEPHQPEDIAEVILQHLEELKVLC